MAAYVLILSTATALGHGMLGTLTQDAAVRVSSAFFAASTTLYWLFRNPRMRVYFARIGGRQVAPELQERVEALEAASGPGVRARMAIEWLVEWVELLILLGFIATVFFALHSMSV